MNHRFRLSIKIDSESQRVIVLDEISADLTVIELIDQLLSSLNLPVGERWNLIYRDSILNPQSSLGLCLPETHDLIELVFSRKTSPSPTRGVDHSTAEGLSLDLDDYSTDLTAIEDDLEEIDASDLLVDEDESDAIAESDLLQDVEALIEIDDDADLLRKRKIVVLKDELEPAKRRTKKSKSVTRRATVRYYRRMNPERVYPLLVLITKELIEKVRKKDIDQRSSDRFQIEKDTPVEIEPILPGCDCHPPKLVVRLSGGDLTAKFRVVPRVLGRIDGASVSIRQDHDLVAEIPLNAKVVQRLWVILCGVMTFLLPCISAILKHFGLDFEAQRDHGYSLYLIAARLVFDDLTPFALTSGLGCVTGFVWWFTRPQTRDVFWDIKKIGPAEKLEIIANGIESKPQATLQELADLLNSFPDFQPALLFSANWHFKNQDYRMALREYRRAFKLGAAKAHEYGRASLAASKLGENEIALRILQDATRTLPTREITGVMLYNMGCYWAAENPNPLRPTLLRLPWRV